MKLKYTSISLLILILFTSTIGYSQIETNLTVTESNVAVENDLLYNTNWKLSKMEPKLNNGIELSFNFERTANQLKIEKVTSSTPVLQGTNLVTTKSNSSDFFQWSYGVKNTEYEGDNIKAVIYDYSIIELKIEGYAFKIITLDETDLVLEVIKSPKVIFGSSISKKQKIYFTK